MKIKKPYIINIGLFLLTFITTTIVGTISYLSFEYYNKQLSTEFIKNYLLKPENYLLGLYYSLPLLIILFAHEMGHYLMCKKYGIEATLPYFIPAPTLAGTFGAVIKIKEPFYSKKSLFDVAIAGPLLSFILSIPILIYGISMSKIVSGPMPEGGFGLGEPIIFKIISSLFYKNLPPTTDLLIHPLAFAGWFGILVTAFNLLPIGQLDGGHILYAISSKLHKIFSYIIIGFLIISGFLFWQGWFLWAILIMLFGTKHPPVYDSFTKLGKNRITLFILIIIVFILSFTPNPIYIK
jgi:membrane-associated protease RseP (regulator of RpoE activity)